ncbi:CBF/Mak21 family-domain-containing protein [Tirmania nivea]|nr:CBF/Mak21 family-domain-containing protein [Tirmania nivea]
MAPSEPANGKKRKRPEVTKPTSAAKKGQSSTQKPISEATSPAVVRTSDQGPELTQSHILELEELIIESPRNYNHIVTLLTSLQDFASPSLGITSAVSLCRTFCRLLAIGRMKKKDTDNPAEAKLLVWLKERYKDYLKELGALLGSGEVFYQTTALTLLMKLVKEEGAHLKGPGDDYFFPHDLMARIANGILYTDFSEDATLRDEFVQKWLDEYHDVRYSFLFVTLTLAEQALTSPSLPLFRSNLLTILLSLQNLPKDPKSYTLSPFYVLNLPTKKSKKCSTSKAPPIISPTSHRTQLSDLWLATLRLPLTPDEQKNVLSSMTHSIVPYFTHPHLLFDFLTDCYNQGSVMAILALNGLFELIKAKNLDYPNFYEKLYALFDRNLMHVRYRSRFFRLVEIFLNSTHIPANLVASFIKRMSRLALTAPPSAIVIVVPLVYNLLKSHPSCTFMVHRERYDRDAARKEGYEDPFDMNEPDPMKTNAIESSLWELVMLQEHYHPSVATLARIVSEQFTKESYKLEDFLDHSYASMIDAELRKNIRNDPVVAYDIPKRIFTIVPPAVEVGDMVGDLKQVMEGNNLTDLWAF